MRRTGVFASLFLFAITLNAQTTSESVLVQVVEVPVTVVGSDGKAVRGLTKENFELFDEGKRVPIDYFEVLDMKALALGNRKSRPPAAATRNFLLLFDLANSSPGSVQRAGDAAKEFVATLGPTDLAAVATLTAEEGARMITSFTADRKMLEAAITTLGNPQYFKVADPLMISFKTTSQMETAIGAVEAASNEKQLARAEAKLGPALAAEEWLDPTTSNKVAQQSANTEARNRLRIQLSNMGSVARMLDRLHGRKQIILLSEGFDPRLVQGGQGSRNEQQQQEEDRRQRTGEVWNRDSDQTYGAATAARDVTDMVELFRRSDVVLHAIDIKGLRGSTDMTATQTGAAGRSNESLFMLTRPTGGTVFQNSNDFAATFARMLEQQEVVYLLGFTAKGSGNPGAFRDLKVKTTVRGARVSHRTGYYEPSNAATNIEKTLSTAEIFLTDAPVRDLDVSLAATALPGPDGKARVPVVVELPGDKFLQGLTGTNATANLFLYAFDAENRVQDYLTQRISLDLTKAADALRGTGIRYFGTLRLTPGSYAIKVVARVEDTNRAGFARLDLNVPAFGTGAILPPLFVDEPADWVMLAGPTRGDEYAYPFAAGEQKFVPRGRPKLSASSEYKLALFAYDISLEGLGLKPAIVGADGTTQQASLTVIGRTAPDDWGGSKLLFAFKPQGLARGNYELHLGVKPAAGAEAQFALPFSVE